MKLLHTNYGADRKAHIFHNDHCYVVELYISDRLYRKMNVLETLVDAKHLVEVFLNEGRTQQLLNENG
jgi:hypothetical protein